MDGSLKAFIGNCAVFIGGVIATMTALVCLTAWPTWAHFLVFPFVVVAWHLLVERVLSGVVNWIFER